MKLSKNLKERIIVSLTDTKAGKELINAIESGTGGGGPTITATSPIVYNPISGNISLNFGGSSSQYIRGDGSVENLSAILPATQQVKYVAKNGNDITGTGAANAPYLTIAGALAAITDASPTKRYVISVASGDYTEASLALKANVFVVGASKESTKITLSAGSVAMAADFTGSADNRSGFSRVTITTPCDFNWATVTSAAGKLYFSEVSFSTTVSLYGHNNAIAQAQFNSCVFFGTFTISGINVGVHTNNVHFSNIALNQHPNAGMATILNIAGGYCSGSVTLITTVNNFGRRCSLFARAFYMQSITVNGASSYADLTNDSIPTAGPTVLNAGNVVYLNASGANATLSNLVFPTAVNQPIIPANTNATNMGDWGKQWFWNFGYVHASTGTDLYLISYASAYGPDTTGRNIGIYPDGAGLQTDVNGGDVDIETAAVSGTGIRGKIRLSARVVDVDNKNIENVAAPTQTHHAANKSYVDTAVAPKAGATRPLSPATGLMFFDTSLGKPIWYSGTAWVDATGTTV